MSMLVHAHSGLRWVVLLLLIAATFMALLKWRSNAPFTEGDHKLNLFTMTAAHIQFLLGMVLLFVSPKVKFSGLDMKNPIERFFTMEHSLMMILAVVFISIGYSKAKKAVAESQKFKTTFIYYFIALLLLLAGIPWPFRNLGAGWF